MAENHYHYDTIKVTAFDRVVWYCLILLFISGGLWQWNDTWGEIRHSQLCCDACPFRASLHCQLCRLLLRDVTGTDISPWIFFMNIPLLASASPMVCLHSVAQPIVPSNNSLLIKPQQSDLSTLTDDTWCGPRWRSRTKTGSGLFFFLLRCDVTMATGQCCRSSGSKLTPFDDFGSAVGECH